MKTIMVLGASRSQLPLLRAARRIGVRSIVVSTPGSWPGFAEADVSVYADIMDPEAVLASARQYSIDGITTCCMDRGVEAVGKVCSEMGLCGPSYGAAAAARNKALSKEAFCRSGVNTARFHRAASPKELETALKDLGLPVVVKAVDLMGSRGIFLCGTNEEAERAFAQAMEETRAGYVLVEEFLQGILFDAEAMIQNGKLVFCMLNDTRIIRTAVPTSIGHTIPFAMEELLGENAREQVFRAVRAIGLDNTAVDLDMMAVDGEAYVIEVNGRAGASCLPEMVGLRYGTDYYEALIRLALGEDVAGMFARPDMEKAVMARMLCAKQDGIVRRIDGLEKARALRHPSVRCRDLSLDIKEGDPVRKYANGRDRIGQVILEGASLPACEELLEQILGTVSVTVSPPGQDMDIGRNA